MFTMYNATSVPRAWAEESFFVYCIWKDFSTSFTCKLGSARYTHFPSPVEGCYAWLTEEIVTSLMNRSFQILIGVVLIEPRVFNQQIYANAVLRSLL